MKIHLLSDLHLEFENFVPEVSDADVTVLAGDIHLRTRGVEWAKQTFKGRVLYVPGNHEYYGGNLGKTLVKMSDAGDDRVRVLDCERVDLDGVRFLGATAWTDYAATGDPLTAQMDARETMTDFRKIRTGSN
jgi:predicted phosphodiesterase